MDDVESLYVTGTPLTERLKSFVQAMQTISLPPGGGRSILDEWEDYTQQPPTRPRPVPIVSSYHTEEIEMDEAFDAIMANDETTEIKAAGITHGGALRAVMGELKAGGMPIFEIIRMIPAIVDLLVTVGPQIADIVKKIRELFEKK